MKIKIPKSKKAIILRFFGFHTIAYFISIAGCFADDSGYWQTIFNVQTVDFNILSHTLPTKLSILLIQNNKDRELEKTIHSNYRLFKLIVTDCNIAVKECPNQKILYYSGLTHQKPNDLNILLNYPYDLLSDPPPIRAEYYYPKLYLDQRKKTGKNNPGRIIGRVYYIRGNQPNFFTEYLGFIQNPFRYGYRSILYGENTLLFLILGFILWVFFERGIKISEQKQSLLNIELELSKQRQSLLEAEIKSERMEQLNKTFASVVETEFSAKITNSIQELDILIKNIISRLNYDTQNIVHDIMKAPVLCFPDKFDNFLNSQNIIGINPELLELLKNADESIKSIDLVVKELTEITNLEEQPTLLQNELRNLKNNLPPLVTKRISVEFDFAEESLWISCNPWRFRSIIRNALYNSSAALKKYMISPNKPVNFQPKIVVKCYLENNFAITEIIDNGSGIPLNIIEKLYESEERLNTNAGELAGNGSLIIAAYLKFHNGKVKKKNLPTSGASVSFLFPIISEP